SLLSIRECSTDLLTDHFLRRYIDDFRLPLHRPVVRVLPDHICPTCHCLELDQDCILSVHTVSDENELERSCSGQQLIPLDPTHSAPFPVDLLDDQALAVRARLVFNHGNLRPV